MDAPVVDQLPVTATEIASWAIAVVAIAVVVLGGIMLLVSRRRRAAAEARADDATDADRGAAPDA